MQTSKWTSWIASWIHSCEVWRRRSEWRTDIPKLSAFRQHLKLRMLIRLSWRVVIRKDGTSDIAWENFIRSFRCRRMSWPRLLRKKIQRMKKKKKMESVVLQKPRKVFPKKYSTKLLHSYQTLCNPMDCSLPRSSVHGIFQARVLEWGATAFSECIS